MMKINKIIPVFFSLILHFFTFGQVDLGTASSFVMFTSAGAFDNTGASSFVGDIGTYIGETTGFPPGTVTGEIHDENSTSLKAAGDVEEAYSYLAGVTCDSTIGNVLGDGQTLKPYTYCILTAASLTGELIFDGENNPDAVFIIKITGLIDVIELSEIKIINSASVSNIYWQVDGAVNVGDNAIFKGTILANGALSFTDGSALEGRGLSRDGAISTISISASLPNSSLPVELIKFEGKYMHSHNVISWSTVSETNNDYFTLKKTTDGFNYITLFNISGAGTSTSRNNYTYSDYGFKEKINYYSLTQTDYDGASKTFSLISINNTLVPKTIIKIFNMMGQAVDKRFIGLRVIYFSNGEVLKIIGKYVPSQ